MCQIKKSFFSKVSSFHVLTTLFQFNFFTNFTSKSPVNWEFSCPFINKKSVFSTNKKLCVVKNCFLVSTFLYLNTILKRIAMIFQKNPKSKINYFIRKNFYMTRVFKWIWYKYNLYSFLTGYLPLTSKLINVNDWLLRKTTTCCCRHHHGRVHNNGGIQTICGVS